MTEEDNKIENRKNNVGGNNMQEIILNENVNCIAIVKKFEYSGPEAYKIMGDFDNVNKLAELGFDGITRYLKEKEVEEFVKKENTKEEIYDFIMSKINDLDIRNVLEQNSIIKVSDSSYEFGGEEMLAGQTVVINYAMYDMYKSLVDDNLQTVDDIFTEQA